MIKVDVIANNCSNIYRMNRELMPEDELFGLVDQDLWTMPNVISEAPQLDEVGACTSVARHKFRACLAPYWTLYPLRFVV